MLHIDIYSFRHVIQHNNKCYVNFDATAIVIRC